MLKPPSLTSLEPRGLKASYASPSSPTTRASAVWRNLYKARADVDVRALAAVVSWIRASLVQFEHMDDVELLACVTGKLEVCSSGTREEGNDDRK
ncbi:hypothetical protein B0T24DRAFT_702002 [Lasiosphaeria ovina]|uniref:Ubiquinol-cytochrome c chaperone domain-containing protein n=1 Tax=Lasiosphaeria ovina TaxID=92902 RepID=A0AAE0N6P1_9PEZI|nr:hypothetical protein B0T24DRAFT_702002 [Lasiosphaeria ovina]